MQGFEAPAYLALAVVVAVVVVAVVRLLLAAVAVVLLLAAVAMVLLAAPVQVVPGAAPLLVDAFVVVCRLVVKQQASYFCRDYYYQGGIVLQCFSPDNSPIQQGYQN